MARRRTSTLPVLASVALLAGAAPASATTNLTATRIRIGDHPAFVRVVVDFTDGTLRDRQVEATDPAPLDGRGRVRISVRGVRNEAARRSGFGATAGIVQGHDHIDLALAAPNLRFKGLRYEVLGSPTRLAVDLWKAAPPTPAATILRGARGCLTLDAVTVAAGRIGVRGTERGLFEHQFAVGLRRADGSVLVQRGVTAASGRWSARLPVRVARAQWGTLEAFDGSAKDGSIDCIVQQRVRLIPA